MNGAKYLQKKLCWGYFFKTEKPLMKNKSTIDGDLFSDSDSNTVNEDLYSSSSASLDSSDNGSSDSVTDSSTEKR